MWIKRALLVAMVVAGGAVALAPSASADVSVQAPCPSGYFCAYDGSSYTTELLRSRDTSSGKIDVVNDKVSSADNQTAACWRGRNHRSFRPDTTTHMWPPFTTAVASDNNNTDHFDHSCNW